MVEIKLVTTPIGNLEDLTPRAKRALEESSLILAEDTRVTRSLYDLLEIPTIGRKFVAFHDHNQKQIDKLIEELSSSGPCCIVSDAGSPIISDPAYPLIRAILAAGGKVETVPGVTSVVTALELSGLPPQPYTFHGFLGRKKSEIITKLEECESFGGTHIFFESPHRIESTLESMAENFPDIDVALCRELTKKFESAYRFKASEWRTQDITVKGEFVLLVHFSRAEKSTGSSKELEKLAQAYMKKKTPKNLSKLLSPILGLSTSEVYSLLSDK